MEGWILFWKVFFVLTLVLFAGMSVWVIIGGFADIKRLFARMSEPRRDTEDEE